MTSSEIDEPSCFYGAFSAFAQSAHLGKLTPSVAKGVARMVEWFTPDVFIVLITAFIAISALGRLMLKKRNQLLTELSRQAQAAERKRKKEERKAAFEAANQSTNMAA